MNNEPTKWLEQNDQNLRLADTGLDPRADLIGHRLSWSPNDMITGLDRNFVEKFGFEVIVTPDSAGRVIYGHDKFTLELRIPQPEVVNLGGDAAATEHPLQLYTATVDGDPVVRVRYGSVWGMVPEEVDGGGAPASFTPSDGLKVWAEVTVGAADGLPVDSAIASGEEVPVDTATTGHFLIGGVAVSGDTVTLYQAVTHSLNGQTCGVLVYNWWAV